MHRDPFARAFARSAIPLAAAMPAAVRANPIMVPGLGAPGPLGLLVALVIEVPIVAAFLPGGRLRLGLACAVATSVTDSLLHWALAALASWGPVTLLLGEALVTLAEAAAYAVASRQRGRSLVASVVANCASLVIGGPPF